MRVNNSREQIDLAKKENKSLFVAGFETDKYKASMSGVMPHDAAKSLCQLTILVQKQKVPAAELAALVEKYQD